MMLYEWYEAQRALLSPFSEFASASSKLYNHPLSLFAHTPHGAPGLGRPRADAPARQGLREAGVRHPLDRRRRRRGRRARAGGDREALLPAAALQALHRRPADAAAAEDAADRARRRAALGPPLDAAARDRARAAEGPQGLHHRLDRCAHGPGGAGPFHLDDYVALRPGVHPPHRPRGQRDLGVPADRAGARRDLADGQRRRADAAHDDDDGRPDRCPQEPDGGEQPGDEQEPCPGSRTTSSTACR